MSTIPIAIGMNSVPYLCGAATLSSVFLLQINKEYKKILSRYAWSPAKGGTSCDLPACRQAGVCSEGAGKTNWLGESHFIHCLKQVMIRIIRNKIYHHSI
jgi:hypothetical protein